MATNTVEVDVLQIKTDGAEKSTQSLKARLKEVREEMANLAAQGDRTSETYQRLAQEAGDLSKAQRLVNKDISEASTTFTNSVQYTAGALAGVSGAVQTVTAALSMMGVEMGDDSKLMKMLVSAMSVTSGLQAIQGGVEAFKLLTNNIKRSTIAQKALNLAMSSNPIMLIATAAIAAGGALYAFISSQRDTKKETDNTNKSLKEQYDLLSKIESYTNKQGVGQAFFKTYGYMRTQLLKDADSKVWQHSAEQIGAYIEQQKALNDTWIKSKEGIDYLKRYREALIASVEPGDYENAAKVFRKIKEIDDVIAGKKDGKTVTAKTAVYTDYQKRLNEINLEYERFGDAIKKNKAIYELEVEQLSNMTKGTKEYDEQLIKATKARNEYRESFGWFNDSGIEKLPTSTDVVFEPLQKMPQIFLEAEENENSFFENLKVDLTVAADWWKEYGSAVAGVTGNIVSWLSTLSQNEDLTFKEQKQLKIAMATISTIQGAVDAFMGSISAYGMPLGLTLGGINAAIVTAAGIAQINQIKNTSKNNASLGGNISATAAQATTPYMNTRITNGDGTIYDMSGLESKLGDQKVILSMREFYDADKNYREVKTRSTY